MKPAPADGDDLLLKVTPPRIPRDLIVRRHLQAVQARLRDSAVLLVQAPAGYGKTSLLAQWRREHLAHGAVVAWLRAQPQDDAQRLVQALALATRQAAGRPGFGHALLDSPHTSAQSGLTSWLAEVAQTAVDMVLFVDEAERFAPAARDALTYLMRNAPPNLRLVVAARSGVDFDIADLIDYGSCKVVGQALLRFDLDECIALARARHGERADVEAAARLHALTEGWPLALQLALSAAAEGALGAVVAAASAPGGARREQLVNLLLARTDAEDLRFLTRISILDALHPDLCRALTGDDSAAARLTRLQHDTPLLAATEQGEWLHLHALARDTLREGVHALPADERAGLHERAAAWLEGHGWLEPAAEHALAAGRHEHAYALAERCLYEAMMGSGRTVSVLSWLDRMPAHEIDRRPRLMLAVAWSLALGNRHDEAGRWIERILAQPGVDAALRCECALIESGAAIFADDLDRFAALHDPWAEAPPLRDAVLRHVHANRSALRSLIDGDPQLARLRQQQALVNPGTLDYLSRWSDFIVGLSYVWEGQVLLAEELLRPALAASEANLGRRSPFATMLAALLATAVWERDRPDEAQSLLANRLDVLERDGTPDAVMLGYRTLARAAAAQGAEHRAIDLLGAMDAIGNARRMPRLRITSLAEQVRLHARRFRGQTCRELVERIDVLLAAASSAQGRIGRRMVSVLHDVALAYAAVALQDWRGAIDRLGRAGAAAQQLGQGRLHIEMLALRAYAMDQCGERALPLLREAIDLAAARGLTRIFVDAHPALGDWVASVAGVPGAAASATGPGQPTAPPMRERAAPSMALTPKEREVLELVARNLSNKEVALAMQVGEQTIKWHVKNLFAKLDAGSRKQAVSRARLLGLLDVN